MFSPSFLLRVPLQEPKGQTWQSSYGDKIPTFKLFQP